MKNPKSFYVRTYGCQMNELDTEVIVGQLEHRGLTRTQVEEDADMLIFNTCSIRDLAERKVMGKLGKLGRNKRRRSAIIGVTGCMANAKKDSLFYKLPHIDFVLGTNNIHDLNTVLDEVLATGEQTIRTEDQFYQEIDWKLTKRDDNVKAFVNIIRGCSKFCTYCVVPYTRGQEVSRTPDDIEAECRHLAEQGFKEITLLGQNVNSYGKDQPEWNFLFHDLIYRLDKIDGIERIRFLTSHPVDITRELMEAIRDCPSACDFVHFPLQAGSDRVLRKMHRIYTVDEYLEKVALLREIVPNVKLGTDIIVGFPTETDEEFEETYRLMEEIEYATAFIFAYSARKGTPAMRWRDDIPEEVKQQRLQRLLNLQNSLQAKQFEQMLGQEVEVLVEKRNAKDKALLKGRTTCWRKVLFEGPDSLIGTLQPVKLHSFSNQSFLGTV